MRLGIIDIGYNAIRASVYEDLTFGAPEIFNNKFKNDILNLLAYEDIKIKHQTYLSIQYIIHIFRRLNVGTIKCVATAVLRGHPKADNFVQYIRNQFDLDIEIIDGNKEAYLTALGLISGINKADGIAADLGGGSLELVEVQAQKVGKLKSLALGTKIINAKNIQNIEIITNIIREQYGNQTYNNLYLIGGALRFISKFFIDFTYYPIKNLHNLEIDTQEFADYLTKIQSPQTANIQLKEKRINSNAILVAKAMIEVFKPTKITVSTFGLKEGVRFAMLDKSQQEKNIIIEKVKYRCNYNENQTNFVGYLNVLNTVIDIEDLEIILKLSIMFLSLNKYFDHTLPPKFLTETVLSSEIPFTHRLRIMLTLVLLYTSNFKPDSNILKLARKLISEADHNHSQIIGHFLRIAMDIDGPAFTSPGFSMTLQNYYLTINTEQILPRAIFDKICERLKLITFARKMHSIES